MTNDQDGCNEVKYKGWPKAGFEIYDNTKNQKDGTKKEPVFNNKI